MDADEFRRLALSQEGAEEGMHGGHPDFRVGGRVFASLGSPDPEWAMLRLTPDQQAAALEAHADLLQPCAGAWGRRGYTNIDLALATRAQLLPLLAQASGNLRRGESRS